jgi:hypothetical protein
MECLAIVQMAALHWDPKWLRLMPCPVRANNGIKGTDLHKTTDEGLRESHFDLSEAFLILPPKILCYGLKKGPVKAQVLKTWSQVWAIGRW